MCLQFGFVWCGWCCWFGVLFFIVFACVHYWFCCFPMLFLFSLLFVFDGLLLFWMYLLGFAFINSVAYIFVFNLWFCFVSVVVFMLLNSLCINIVFWRYLLVWLLDFVIVVASWCLFWGFSFNLDSYLDLFCFVFLVVCLFGAFGVLDCFLIYLGFITLMIWVL